MAHHQLAGGIDVLHVLPAQAELLLLLCVSSGYLLTAVTYWSMVPSADGTGKFKVAVGLDIENFPNICRLPDCADGAPCISTPRGGSVVQATVVCRTCRAQLVLPLASPECIR